MSKSKKVIGIDLGTGFSCVSVVEGGQPKVIVNSDGKETTPSVVTFAKDGEIKVGDSAKRSAVMEPTRTISFIKRFMGQTWDQVQDEVKRAQYKVVKGSNNMPKVDIDGKLYSPEEISAVILQKMKKTAEDYLGEEVEDCVITCPAYYDDVARNAVKNAGKIAGLNVLRVINEPTAASLAYGINADKDQKILVCDIGCGTSDFTTIDLSSGVYEVVATNGDIHLGGDDFDQCIIDWLVSEFKKDYSDVDLAKDPMAMQRLKESAEKAKIELSSSTTTEINLPYIASVGNTPVHLIKTLTRAQFEKLSDKLISRIMDTCKTCVEKSKLTVKDIDELVLVGGTTRIPALQSALETYFGKKPNKSANPDTAISCGAAIQGAVLSGDKSVNDVLLLDVTPLSLGIETLGGVFTKIIDANTTIPVTKSQIFSTAEDNQPSVEIRVLQGERPMAKDNKQIGIFTLDGIMPAKRGVPQVEVKFDLDANGILNVSATDKATGKAQNVRIEGSSGLSDTEIERMKKEAEANADADKKEMERVQSLNLAESTIFQTEKRIEELGDKLTDEQKNDLNNGLTALKDAYEQKDPESCKSCVDILNQSWYKISESLYKDSGTDNTTGTQNPIDDLMNNMNKQ
jgi:molecular chaperone DnaK